MSKPPSSSPTFLLLVLVLIGAAVVLVGQVRSRPTVSLPAPLPDVKVQGWLNTNTPPTTADLAGKWVVVDLWATWCGPCVASLPEMAAFRQRWPEIPVIGIADDGAESLGELHDVIQGVPGFNWPVAFGGTEAFQRFEANAIPMVVLFSPDGQIAWSGHSIDQLEQVLRGHLSN